MPTGEALNETAVLAAVLAQNAVKRQGELRAELAEARDEIKRLRAELVNLNRCIDDFWNAPDRPSIYNMRSGADTRLCDAQNRCKQLLES